MSESIPVHDPLNDAVPPNRGGGRVWRGRRAACTLLALLAGGCGTVTTAPSADRLRPPAPSRWPTAADYTTIRIAAEVRDQALFHETDWRRRSQAAALALRTLLTVRIAAGPCAAYVTQLYGDLRGLLDAYAGEDWRPLIRLVHREPSLARSCRTAQSTASRALRHNSDLRATSEAANAPTRPRRRHSKRLAVSTTTTGPDRSSEVSLPSTPAWNPPRPTTSAVINDEPRDFAETPWGLSSA